MHIIQEEIGLPKFDFKRLGDFHVLFTFSPLPPGYGMTLGNALRRVLISSLPGAAITAIKIKGISHEYSTLKGVKDSVLDIILNLKNVQLKKESKGATIVKLKKTGPGDGNGGQKPIRVKEGILDAPCKDMWFFFQGTGQDERQVGGKIPEFQVDRRGELKRGLCAGATAQNRVQYHVS